MTQIKANLLPGQQAFLDCKVKFPFWTSGLGGGKTYGLMLKMFQLMNLNPGLPGGILCPTTKMYKRDVLPTIYDICLENGIRPKYNKSEMTWHFGETNSTVYVFHGEDEGRSIRGPNLAWMVINESTLLDKMTILHAVGRVRIKDAPLLQMPMSGTPEGFTFAHEQFVETPRDDVDWICSPSTDNVHVDSSYFETLKGQYDPIMLEQYLHGKFVNLMGNRAVYAFDRNLHTSIDVEKIKGLPVLVSMDFNVDPMAATLWNRVPFGYDIARRGPLGHYIHGFDEICLRNSNTYEICKVLRSKTPKTDSVVIYPDPAGTSRSTQSADMLSDIDILRQHGFNDIRYKPRISLKACWNSLNAAYAKNWIKLNSKRCRETIKDHEQCILKKDSFEIDKKNHMRSHWLDGTKNMIEYEFPIRRDIPRVQIERIR